MKDALLKLTRGLDLTADETADAFRAIMSGNADPAATGGLLIGLAAKGVTAPELVGAARVMREHVVPVNTGDDIVLDTCGTGGDRRGTFNISTAAALVAAASGVKVVKHGNRSASGKTGSADVLEELGVNIDLTGEALRHCLDEAGICFAFARSHHPAMKHVAPVRNALGVPTIFNLLGPLTNPAGAKRQLMGVFRSELCELMAEVLRDLGSQRAWVVCADDGLDEVSTSSPTRVCELRDGKIVPLTINPTQLGVKTGDEKQLLAESPKASARIIREIFDGRDGSARDIVLLNAAAALVVADAADGLDDALGIAAHAIDSGRAGETLETLAAVSRQ